MYAIQMLIGAVMIHALAAVTSLVFRRDDGAAIAAAGFGGALAGLLGLLAGLSALGAAPVAVDWGGPFPFAPFTLRLDGLSGLMVAVISGLTVVASIYSLAYVREYAGRGVGAMGFFTNLFVASMLLVVTADDAFWFLVFFEMMSLASYFLVIFDQNEEAVSAGFLYFLVAHAGSVAIMAAFFLMANSAGSFSFAAFRAHHPSETVASIAFVLALAGFGAKAGMIPLHVWLPRAHPAAPSHASALMSGVMIKIGVFGIVKVGIDLLGGGVAWWGLLVLALGAISSVMGVIYALAEHDIKKLLAYHSVENIGIILLGVGTGMIGLSTGHPVVAALGLTAGLYHLVNHAVFKGLLFLGAGSVIFRMHTKDMEKMGGLGRVMPWTSLSFLIGALAISAIPPLNGFVSEWLTYQGLFVAALDGSFATRLATPIAATLLALTGALAGDVLRQGLWRDLLRRAAQPSGRRSDGSSGRDGDRHDRAGARLRRARPRRAAGGAGVGVRFGADPEPAGDRLRRRRGAERRRDGALDADGRAAPDRARHAAGAARVALRDRPPRAARR